MLVIGFAAVRLAMRVRKGKFGSRLLFKLAGIFALVGVVPGVLIYTVSYQFVSRSIETWFDVARRRRARCRPESRAAARSTRWCSELAAKTRTAAERLGESRTLQQPLALERLREQLSARRGRGARTERPGAADGRRQPGSPPSGRLAALLRQARTQRVVSQLEGLEDDVQVAPSSNARVRALAAIPSSDITLARRAALPDGHAHACRPR